jgi:putative hemolysin
VYEGKQDDIVGYVAVRDLLRQALEQRPIDVEQALRPATFVPESKLAVELLREMRDRHLAIAIAVDEQGGTAGIVTMEDLIEELVGDIFSEHAGPPPQPIIMCEDGSALVNGTTPIREVNRALGIELPDDGDWTTLAGLCLALAGTIPVNGRVLSLPRSITLEIVDASPRRVRTVRVRSAAPATAEA